MRSRPWRRSHRRGRPLSLSPRSFDGARRRPAPDTATLYDAQGHAHDVRFTPRTLLVAVKPDCDGCRPFYEAPLDELADWTLYVVTASEESFPTARRPVWRAPALLEALGVTWPPFYVALNDDPLHVVAEGVVFAPEQIASELAAT